MSEFLPRRMKNAADRGGRFAVSLNGDGSDGSIIFEKRRLYLVATTWGLPQQHFVFDIVISGSCLLPL